MGSHTHDSPEYWAQLFKDFLIKPKENYIIRKLGFWVTEVKHQGDLVTFKYLNETVAIGFSKTSTDKAEVTLELKVGDDWVEIKRRFFKSKITQKGKISDKTYEPVIDNLVIEGIKSYRRP